MRAIALFLCLVMAACAGTPPPAPPPRQVAQPRPAPAPAPQRLTPIAPTSLSQPMQCVPYARQVSGIPLRGDAWTWWDQAADQFARGSHPVPGAVFVLSRSRKLSRGHLSVVAAVGGPREILVRHTNWGWDRRTRLMEHHGQPVLDVSPRNDWSEVRFWNFEAGAYGSPYPATGFIYPFPLGPGGPAGRPDIMIANR